MKKGLEFFKSFSLQTEALAQRCLLLQGGLKTTVLFLQEKSKKIKTPLATGRGIGTVAPSKHETTEM